MAINSLPNLMLKMRSGWINVYLFAAHWQTLNILSNENVPTIYVKNFSCNVRSQFRSKK